MNRGSLLAVAVMAVALSVSPSTLLAPPEDAGRVARARGSVSLTQRPTPSTTPPSDFATHWAPAPGDPGWANVATFGAVGDGIADDTIALRKAAATGKKLFIPKPPVAYKLTGVVQIRNSVYGDGSMPEIRMWGADGDPDQRDTHNILLIEGYSGPGLTVNGLHLNGQWDGVGKKGEWSHCIRIMASSNVTVENCILERPYGDCIFVGHYSWNSPPVAPSEILIQNSTLRGPRRCCITLVSGTNITIRNNNISKASDFVAAIDLEPDPLGYQHLDGITITGNTLQVHPIAFGGGAINLNNPFGNAGAPASGNVSITKNRGTWTPAAAYLQVLGSDGLVGIVPNLFWFNLTVFDNFRAVRSRCGCAR